ncbi:MAG: CARDB domain-containing protein [Myxococcota bacterium]
MRRIATVLFLLSGCLQTPEDSGVRNQFQTQREALTLTDGGQCAISIDAGSELLITDLRVVEDARATGGAWSFGSLMTSMAGPHAAPAFVESWLRQWSAPQLINGFTVPARPAIQSMVLDPWPRTSAGLDLSRAPFRLLAIVNRLDLRDLAHGSAGEGRFIFGVLDRNGAPLQFTVILEFNLPATTAADVRRWADDFHTLGALERGSPAFNTALEAITNRFSGPNAAPGRPNGSAINQVRTNEIALAAPWELREFTLDANGQLRQSPPMQTPDLSFNGSSSLATFINTNEAALLAGNHAVPTTFLGRPFLGGNAPTEPGFFWNASGVSSEALFRFSVNTCNGCHAGDTGTRFTHVSPRSAGAESPLSGFLTGTTAFARGQSRAFNDLATRASSLADVLCDDGFVAITAPAANATLSGRITLRATVAAGVERVAYLVDGSRVAEVRAPFTAEWNASTAAPGPHVLTAVATFSDGTTITSRPVSVRAAPTVDLVVTEVAAPASAVPETPFTVQVSVCNRGNAFATTTVDVFLSRDAVFSADDSSLGQRPVSLAPWQCRSVSVSGVPSGRLGTSVFVGAVVDRPGAVAELSESNNTALVPLGLGLAPDFTVKLETAPAVALPGAALAVTVSVCNQGTLPGRPTVELLSSLDADFALPQDRRLGRIDGPELTPGQCAVLPMTGVALAPEGAPSGSSFLGALVDPDAAVAELLETNNASPARRFAVGNGPDFRVASVTAPTHLATSPFTSVVQVCNGGNAAASTTVSVVVSLDDVIAPVAAPAADDDRVVGTSGVITAAPGQCVTTSVTCTASVPAAALTTVSLGAMVDASRTLAEVDETNNTGLAVTRVGVGQLPDFTVTHTANPQSAAPGVFSLPVVVCNRGPVRASAELALALAAEPVLTPTPSFLPQVVSLAAGACSSLTLTTPPLAPGSYLITAVVDAPGAVAELLESNNSGTPVPLVIGEQPDFVVTALSGPDNAAPSTPFTVGITLCNRGSAPGTTSVTLVTSLDPTIDRQDWNAGFGPSVTLAAGACVAQQIQTVAVTPFSGIATAWLGAVADANGTTAELSESNNARAAPLQLGIAPDFTVTSTTPTTLAMGRPFAIPATVCNRGTSAGTTSVDLVFSSDSFVALGPGQLDSSLARVTISLAAGACGGVSLEGVATSPTGQPGLVSIGLIVDALDGVRELSEANNQVVRGLTLQ